MSRPAPRLFVEDALESGAEIRLDAGPAHYLAQVLRLKPGAEVRLFNGRDGEWRATLTEAVKRACTLAVEARTRDQQGPPPLTLAFAPLKKSPMDFLIAKAVELGATALQPIITERTETQRLNAERVQAQVREAAEQCERLDLPTLAEPMKFAAFLKAWPEDGTLWAADETGGGAPFAAYAADAPDPAAHAHAILIGPEGGFTAQELASLDGLTFVRRIHLGPRILRAETAALAALTCWQGLFGDWPRIN